MREFIEKILNEYIPAKQEVFTGHSIGRYFREIIPKKLYDTNIINADNYLIKASVGQGNWATIPWIGIFDRSINAKPTRGVYIVYLLNQTGTSLYLTLNQGCTEIRNNHSKNDTIKIMRDNAADICSKIDMRGFRTDEDINLGEELNELGLLYQKGTICYKEYRKDAIPSEDEIQRDFSTMLAVYQAYKNKMYLKDTMELIEGGDGLKVKSSLAQIKNYIRDKGFNYHPGLIENFYLSLKSKPFVLLAGTSGTGKTRLVRLFAEAIGAYADGRYKQVAVRPDWSDSTDLFGHVNLDNKFIPGVIIEFIKKAADDPRKQPHILCFDEMNLARVEYYFSDFLSVMETRDWNNKDIVTDPLVPKNCYSGDKFAESLYTNLMLPENLYVVGTVNMDETTFPFSKKVLDRANTIEFSDVDLELPDDRPIKNSDIVTINNDFLKSEYLNLRMDCFDHWESVKNFNEKITNINAILKMGDVHFGYRMRDEMIFYMLYNEDLELLPEKEAFDNQIMQKILPRIQGSTESVANILRELFKFCAGPFAGQSGQSDAIKMKNYLVEHGLSDYPQSAEKICNMLRRYEENDFTSFWV